MFAEQLLRASIEGGALLLVLYVGLKLIPSIPPLVRVWLWRIAFVKLALSLLPIARIPLNILPPADELPAQQIVLQTSNDAAPQPSLPTSTQWMYAWAAGVSVSGIFLLRRVFIAKAVVSDAKQTNDVALLGSVTQLADRAGLKRMPDLLLNDARSSAVVVGGFKRSIVLPDDQLAEDDKTLILAHEIAHIAHRDLEWNALFSIVQVIFFFHPLVWLALRSVQNAQEAAADALAINLTKASPKRYGEMLVRATVMSASPFPSLAAGLWLGASTGSIRDRIKDLRFVNTRPTAGRIASMITLICLVAAITPAYQLGMRPVAGTTAAIAPVAMQMNHPRATTVRKENRSAKHRKSHRTRRAAPRALQFPVMAAPALAPVAAAAPVSVTTRVAPQAVTVQAATPTTTVSTTPVTAPAAVSVRLEPVKVTVAPAMRPIRVRTIAPTSAKVSISAPATTIATPALAPAAPAAPQAKRARPAKRTRGAHGGTSSAVGYSISTSPTTAIASGDRISSGRIAVATDDATGLGKAQGSGSSNGDTTTIVRSSSANALGGQSVGVGVSVTSNKYSLGSDTITARGQRTNIYQGHGVGKGIGRGVSTASSNGVQARGGN